MAPGRSRAHRRRVRVVLRADVHGDQLRRVVARTELHLTVNGAPVITSAAAATFTEGVAGSFTVIDQRLPDAEHPATGAPRCPRA